MKGLGEAEATIAGIPHAHPACTRTEPRKRLGVTVRNLAASGAAPEPPRDTGPRQPGPARCLLWQGRELGRNRFPARFEARKCVLDLAASGAAPEPPRDTGPRQPGPSRSPLWPGRELGRSVTINIIGWRRTMGTKEDSYPVGVGG